MALLNRTKENPGSSKHHRARRRIRCMSTRRMERKACTVGKTVLFYDARCIDDLHKMLKSAGDWIALGGADEQRPAKEG